MNPGHHRCNYDRCCAWKWPNPDTPKDSTCTNLRDTVSGVNGDEIRRLREAKGWTQPELARAIKVSPRTISNWERGESVPRNRMGMLESLFGDVINPDAPDPLREATDFALLSELLRRALDRERG